MKQDEDQLRLLSIFHYIVGGVAALFSTLPLIHVAVGLTFLLNPPKLDGKGEPMPAVMGWLFVVIGSVLITVGWTFAVFVIAAGRCLARRKRYLFCVVMAGIECIFMPFGTVLGVFTIIVLMRESVKPLFNASAPAQL